MVRVPKLPLSMTAVVSNTPCSISATDMTSVRPLWFIQLFCVDTHSPQNLAWMRLRPSIEAAGESPGRHYRRPPDTDLPFLFGSRRDTRWDGARGSHEPHLFGPIRSRTPLLYTPTWRFMPGPRRRPRTAARSTHSPRRWRTGRR